MPPLFLVIVSLPLLLSVAVDVVRATNQSLCLLYSVRLVPSRPFFAVVLQSTNLVDTIPSHGVFWRFVVSVLGRVVDVVCVCARAYRYVCVSFEMPPPQATTNNATRSCPAKRKKKTREREANLQHHDDNKNNNKLQGTKTNEGQNKRNAPDENRRRGSYQSHRICWTRRRILLKETDLSRSGHEAIEWFTKCSPKRLQTEENNERKNRSGQQKDQPIRKSNRFPLNFQSDREVTKKGDDG